MGPKLWAGTVARHDGEKLLWCLSDHGCVCSGGVCLETPAQVVLREGRALADGGGDVCVSIVGVCVGARNSTAFCADPCSQMCDVCVCLHGIGEFL